MASGKCFRILVEVGGYPREVGPEREDRTDREHIIQCNVFFEAMFASGWQYAFGESLSLTAALGNRLEAGRLAAFGLSLWRRPGGGGTRGLKFRGASHVQAHKVG